MTTREWLESAVIWLALREQTVPDIPGEWFHWNPAATAFRTLRKLAAEGVTLDVSALSGPHLADLMESAPDVYTYFPTLDGAVTALRQDEQTRWVQQRFGQALRQIGEGEAVEDVMGAIERDLAQWRTQHQPMHRLRSLGEVALELYQRIERRVDGEDTSRLPYPWWGWNAPTLGAEAGQLIVIGARTSVGKTLTAVNMARYWAQKGIPSLYVTLEMPDWKIVARLLAQVTGIDGLTLARGVPSDREWEPLSRALGTVQDWPLWLEDVTPLSLSQLGEVVGRAVRDHGIRAVVVDYAGLLDNPPAYRGESQASQVGRIAKTLKQLAMRYDVPVVALVQLNRQTEHRADGVPSLADLRDSGDWEASADVVWLLYRDADHPDAVACLLAKNRDGEANVMTTLSWDKPRNLLWDPRGGGEV